jgi:hypothetical protein
MNSFVIGKRITVGAAVGALITTAAGILNRVYPEVGLTAAEVAGIQTAVVALVQIWVVNKYGVTQPK